MGLLYHYTSLTTLRKITNGIKNEYMHLRAGNAKNMNDPDDCYYFVKILNDINNKISIDEIKKEKVLYDNPYIISLSDCGDDIYMWTHYGDDCKGVAIGFETDDLLTIASQFFEKYHTSTKLHHCLYMDANDVQKHQGLHELICQTDTFNENFWKNNSISDISNFIKHPKFRPESEWRFVIKHGKNEPFFNTIYKAEEDAFYVEIPLSSVKIIKIGSMGDFASVEKKFSQYFPNTEFVKSTIAKE